MGACLHSIQISLRRLPSELLHSVPVQHKNNTGETPKKEPLHLETIMGWRLPFAFSHFPGGPEVRMIHMQVCVNAHHSVIPNTDAECSAVVPEAFFRPA